jgi:hypothetical protein
LILQLSEDAEDDARAPQRAVHQAQLFELATDPDCERDLVATQRARALELRAQLIEWLAGWRGARFALATTLDSRAQRNLAALGYASGASESAGDGPLFDTSCSCAWCASWR